MLSVDQPLLLQAPSLLQQGPAQLQMPPHLELPPARWEAPPEAQELDRISRVKEEELRLALQVTCTLRGLQKGCRGGACWRGRPKGNAAPLALLQQVTLVPHKAQPQVVSPLIKYLCNASRACVKVKGDAHKTVGCAQQPGSHSSRGQLKGRWQACNFHAALGEQGLSLRPPAAHVQGS